jgi:hypothetical protein
MAFPLPLIIAAGAAALLLGKEKKATPANESTIEPVGPGPMLGAGGLMSVQQQQVSLKLLADLGICPCNPGSVDGKAGSKTKRHPTWADPEGGYGLVTEAITWFEHN